MEILKKYDVMVHGYKKNVKQIQSLANANACFEQLRPVLSGRKIALCLDYDGTLTPITARPEEAILSPSMREVLRELSRSLPIMIISGRDRETVQEFIKLPQLTYAGNHGLDIDDSKTLFAEQRIEHFLPLLHEVQQILAIKLASLPGIQIEPKKYTLAIHYRNVAHAAQMVVITTTEAIVRGHSDLKIIYGKKVLDIYPNIEWDKGKALKWLMRKFNVDQPTVYPIYIGDDLTDENAFRTLPELSMGILVGNHEHETYADFGLRNPAEVEIFLTKLSTMKDRD